MASTTCCNGTFQRDPDGTWRYPWGDPVPGAADLTLLEVLALKDPVRFPPGVPAPPATAEDLAWARSLCEISSPVEVHFPDGHRDLVIGLRAPELEVTLMLTVADIAEAAEVSKATVDSYRYRGYLPEPQVTKGRTPLWTRPVIDHWLSNRPGSGWRTDVYGSREAFEPSRRLPISGARGDRGRGGRTTAVTRPSTVGTRTLGGAQPA